MHPLRFFLVFLLVNSLNSGKSQFLAHPDYSSLLDSNELPKTGASIGAVFPTDTGLFVSASLNSRYSGGSKGFALSLSKKTGAFKKGWVFPITPGQTKTQLIPGVGYLVNDEYKSLGIADSVYAEYYDYTQNNIWSRSDPIFNCDVIGYPRDTSSLIVWSDFDLTAFKNKKCLAKINMSNGQVVEQLSLDSLIDSPLAWALGIDSSAAAFFTGGVVRNGNTYITLNAKSQFGKRIWLLVEVGNANFQNFSLDTVSFDKLGFFQFPDNQTDYFYGITDHYNAVDSTSSYTIQVFHTFDSVVSKYSVSNGYLPEPYFGTINARYKNGKLGLQSSYYTKGNWGYGYYPRFRLLDSNAAILYDTYTSVDSTPGTFFNVGYIFLDDSLNFYFTGKIRDFEVYVGNITPTGGVVQPLRVKEILETNQVVLLYPNPASSAMFLDTKEKSISYRAYSILGQVVNIPFDPERLRFDVSHLHKGVYFLQIKSKNGTWSTQKFIKE